MSPSGPLRRAPPPDGRADTRSRRNHGYRRRLREGRQRGRREGAARVLHRARQLYGQLLRRAHRARRPARDVRAHVRRGPRLRLADGPRGGDAGHGGGRVDVLLRRDRRGAAERRPQGTFPRHERLRAGGGAHRALPRVLRHGRGAAPARFRAGLDREGARPPGRLMPPRLAFLDVFRGFALIVMVLNHTGRWWIAREMGWWRYWIVYGTVTEAAPILLFLVGFVLPPSPARPSSSPTRRPRPGCPATRSSPSPSPSAIRRGRGSASCSSASCSAGGGATSPRAGPTRRSSATSPSSAGFSWRSPCSPSSCGPRRLTSASRATAC